MELLSTCIGRPLATRETFSSKESEWQCTLVMGFIDKGSLWVTMEVELYTLVNHKGLSTYLCTTSTGLPSSDSTVSELLTTTPRQE